VGPFPLRAAFKSQQKLNGSVKEPFNHKFEGVKHFCENIFLYENKLILHFKCEPTYPYRIMKRFIFVLKKRNWLRKPEAQSGVKQPNL
jgi:hypothetical protein